MITVLKIVKILGPIPNVNTFDPLKCLIRDKECYIDSQTLKIEI